MATFQDSKGRVWLIEVNVGSLARVKRAAGIDLLTVHDPQSTAWQQLTTNVVTLFDTLVALVGSQLQVQQVTADDFGASLTEEQVEQATQAMLQGVIDFYPPEKRAVMNRFLEAVVVAARNTKARTWGKITAKLNQVSPAELQQRIERELEKTSGASATSSPASSASTPAP